MRCSGPHACNGAITGSVGGATADSATAATGLTALGPLTRMQSLTLWNCLGISERGLRAATRMQGLTALCLRGCQQLSDELLWPLTALPALLRLDLRACERFTGGSINHWWQASARKQWTDKDAPARAIVDATCIFQNACQDMFCLQCYQQLTLEPSSVDGSCSQCMPMQDRSLECCVEAVCKSSTLKAATGG